jgi:microcystin-dependent protein
VGYYALGKITTGNSNTCLGLGAGQNIVNGNNNCVLGQYAGLGLVNVTGSTVLGTTADCSFNYSTALGCNSACTADHQIMLGTVQETVVVPNNLQVNGSINTVSKTVFGYLANVSSDIQQQLTALKSPVTDITWISGPFNTTNIANVCQTNILKFSGTLNNIGTSTFAYLSGLTGNIQNQINNIVSTTPIGTVISFAGSSSSLNGFLPCNGQQYPIPSYIGLYNVIGFTYGGDQSTGFFRVPNYSGLFLRGSGSQAVTLNVIAGAGGAVQKTYNSPSLGTVYADEAAQIQTSNYVNGINTEVKNFVTGGSAFGQNAFSFNYSNAVASMNYTTGSDTLNIGHTENFPVHTSIQYFIKY